MDGGVSYSLRPMARRTSSSSFANESGCRSKIRPRFSPTAKWALLAAGVVVASCINPFGWKLYELPARVLSDTALVRSIGELHSPDFFFVMHFEGMIVFVTILGLITRTFRPRVGELLIYLFFLHQGLQHVRHLTLFGIAMVPMVSRLAIAALESAREAAPRLSGLMRGALPVAALGCAVVLLMNPREGMSYPARNAQFLSGTGYVREAYPSDACDLIELAGLEGRPFNQNWYAGYMMWRACAGEVSSLHRFALRHLRRQVPRRGERDWLRARYVARRSRIWAHS
jgi:hypothetical protein